MKLLFIADGRSPIALNWIGHFTRRGDEVHLASTFPCAPELPLASLSVLPAAFGAAAGAQAGGKGLLRRLIPLQARIGLRQLLGPFTLPGAARKLRRIVAKIQPDLIHAMRIPYEGMLAALALTGGGAPLLVSVWGNDFTLHAASTPLMGSLTRLTLRRAAALHTDCRRDLDDALAWGFAAIKPATVLPGGGGVQADLFYPPPVEPAEPLVINPRGLRAYVRSDSFFKAAALTAELIPAARFLCTGMADEGEAERLLAASGAGQSVTLLPLQTRPQMADLFRRAQVMVSLSEHDGTPNTLLEALACGCFPVAGDIPSLREWITPGVNGLLVDPADAAAAAEAVLTALQDADLRARARQVNLGLIAGRAEHGAVMKQAEAFYRGILD
ncbi:MAG: glycosyltransferase family 4 protein [Chloroflexi bacterium]|nr:glycosyltransferase family 4 protein [Chloroflexota bacterium]